jgi:sec-independent protein translocase protein TatC
MDATPVLSDAPGEQTRKRLSVFAYLRAFGRASRRVADSATPGAMTILGHLEELRIRVLKAGIALVVTTAVSFIYSVKLVDFLTAPIGGRAALASIEVTENISVFMRVALLAGLVLGLPFVLYQAVAYVAPGLSRRERRWLYALIPAATIFFLGGVAFAWFMMIPAAMPFLINFLGIPTHPRRGVNYVQITAFQ